MQEPERPGYLPEADRLSVLAATILLAYALARLIDLPATRLRFEWLSFYISLEISLQALATLLIAALAASGTDWLLRDHPALGKARPPEQRPETQSLPGQRPKKQRTWGHWMLPALTAWTVQLPLSQMPLSPWWWAGFALGGALLILVLVAEYIVVDPEDVRYPPAAAGLTVLSFALFLVLATALRFANLRLLFLLPALAIGGGLVSLRTLHLRLPGQWAFLLAGLVTLIIVQMAAALHYWPLTPVSFGLALLGPAYALTNLVGNLAEGAPLRQAVVEPAVVMFVLWGIAWWMK